MNDLSRGRRCGSALRSVVEGGAGGRNVFWGLRLRRGTRRFFNRVRLRPHSLKMTAVMDVAKKQVLRFAQENGVGLREMDVEQGQPVLERLKSEAAEDEADAEDSETALGKVVGVILDERIDGNADAGDHAGD